jgi:hypothetical protein
VLAVEVLALAPAALELVVEAEDEDPQALSPTARAPVSVSRVAVRTAGWVFRRVSIEVGAPPRLGAAAGCSDPTVSFS